MDTVHMERMRPRQVVDAMNKCPVVYVPLAPLEWHGPHLPIGVDAMHASAVCERVAELVGGVVYPTTYLGTETRRNKEELNWLGFSGDEYVIGMDFPGNILPSVYLDEAVYGVVVREIVRSLKRMGFKIIVLMSGHGALNHNSVLKRIGAEESDNGCQVVHRLVFPSSNESDECHQDFSSTENVEDEETELGVGHASRDETSITMYLFPEGVDLSELPGMDQKLYYRDWGIVDGPAFVGRPTKDRSVRSNDDPRKATPEHGREFLSANVKAIADEVRELLKAVAR